VTVRLVLLGTGTSYGVPQIGCTCPTCTSSDPRDRRTRTAALVETAGRRLLIDTPPELRLQLVAAGVDRVDAVLFTHAHADHVHGIDDLRAISVRHAELPAYGPADTLAELARRFNYIFDDAVRPQQGTAKPRLRPQPLAPDEPAEVAGVPVLPLALPHGALTVFGYRIGPVAYLTDVKAVPEAARARLQGLEVLVLNALLPRPHPLHLSIPEAVATAQAIGARRTLLTHLTHERRHADLAASLPAGIEPGFDGQVVEVD
jgi:phosphoribosyl 1,2-cyclic phosphate phosphodiesterase